MSRRGLFSPGDQPKLHGIFGGARDKIGRNDPCPCGSGNKYKKCCGKLRLSRSKDPSNSILDLENAP